MNLESGTITVQLGKGRKKRVVGIAKNLRPFLEAYLTRRLKLTSSINILFLNSYMFPYKPTTLGRIIKKLGNIAGLPITAHGLRRTFATLNAEQGRPLHLIQLALGHSDIRTTQEYLMSDQEAVIEAMKEW